ncbi:DDT domain-containing protein DDB_G0282237-like isoform X2 [Melospiza melodia melodia]|uniref:DDT domain-containing protein DDB_G0282237-like isoform X2 n=1 Tax=Melospiza melodia melodia TaxID=1914991 RepID=UPI002FD104DF
MDVCSLQSCPDLLAAGLCAGACAGGNACCGEQWDWSRFRCHVLSMTDGRASFSAPKVGPGRRPQPSNTRSPGIQEITAFSAPGFGREDKEKEEDRKEKEEKEKEKTEGEKEKEKQKRRKKEEEKDQGIAKDDEKEDKD